MKHRTTRRFPLPEKARTLSPEQKAALERLLSASHHLGGRAPSRDEMHEKPIKTEAEDEMTVPRTPKKQPESEFPKGTAKPALRALSAAGITRLEDLTRFTESQLSALHGMGPKAIGILKAALSAQGKSLAKD